MSFVQRVFRKVMPVRYSINEVKKRLDYNNVEHGMSDYAIESIVRDVLYSKVPLEQVRNDSVSYVVSVVSQYGSIQSECKRSNTDNILVDS